MEVINNIVTIQLPVALNDLSNNRSWNYLQSASLRLSTVMEIGSIESPYNHATTHVIYVNIIYLKESTYILVEMSYVSIAHMTITKMLLHNMSIDRAFPKKNCLRLNIDVAHNTYSSLPKLNWM